MTYVILIPLEVCFSRVKLSSEKKLSFHYTDILFIFALDFFEQSRI